MKSRWIILLGRIGSVLLVIGLSFMLISLILMSGQKAGPIFPLFPSQWSSFSGGSQMLICHPSKGLSVSLTTNNSLQLYFINMHPQQLREWAMSWVREHNPSLNESQVSSKMRTAPVLEAFLQVHPENVLLNEVANGKLFIEYFPQKVVNITIVVYNSLTTSTSINMELVSISTLIPRQNAVPIAEVLIAFGVVSVLPLTVMKIKSRSRSDRTKV